jgi:gamma-glutamyltranspeptidase/glutathione hydrolase
VCGRLRAAGRRAAPERPGRRPPGCLLAGRDREAARPLRAGRLAGGRDDRGVSLARTCPGAWHRLLAACVPGSFGGWLLLLEQFGTWTLDDVLAYAIGYAEHGYPVVARHHRDDRARRAAAARVARVGRALPAGAQARLDVPQPAAGRDLAAPARRVATGSRGRARGARRVYYEGFVAEEIDRFSREQRRLLTGARPGAWRATLEPPATVDYRGLTVCKTAAWGQGPAGLQQLRLLEGLRRGVALSEVELVHVTTECAKLAFADRDANYGDVDVPLEHLLSREYADERRALIGEEASGELRPGLGRLPQLPTS